MNMGWGPSVTLADEGAGLPANSLNISLLDEKVFAEKENLDKSFNQEPSFLEQESSRFLQSSRNRGKVAAFTNSQHWPTTHTLKNRNA